MVQTVVETRAPRDLSTRICQCGIIFPNSCRTFSKPAEVVIRATKESWFQKVKTVIEYGSGCLRNASFLQSLGFNVAVFEAPKVRSKYEEEYKKFLAAGGQILSQRRNLSKFDVVVITFVLETVCPEFERRKLLKEARDAIRIGGHLVLSVRAAKDVKTSRAAGVYCPIGGGYITPLKTFIKPYDLLSLTKLLRRANFEIEKLYAKSRVLNLVARAI